MFSICKVGCRCKVTSLHEVEWSLFYCILSYFIFSCKYCSLFIRATTPDKKVSLCLVVLASCWGEEVKVCDRGVRGPQRCARPVPDPGPILILDGGQFGPDDPLCWPDGSLQSDPALFDVWPKRESDRCTEQTVKLVKSHVFTGYCKTSVKLRS